MIKGKAIEISTLKWEIAANRFVGFIDIMGFKDLVARSRQIEIYEMMKKIRKSAYDVVFAFGVDHESDTYETDVYISNYSDSIIIYSKDDSPDNLHKFIACISSLLSDLFTNNIPHKGAVAHGNMTLDFRNSIFFGQPLIDAYLLHDELSFYGIVVHATADAQLRVFCEEGIFEYNCPFKTGSSLHMTILPDLFYVSPVPEDRYLQFIDSVKQLRNKTSGALRTYIDRTIQYFGFAKESIAKK